MTDPFVPPPSYQLSQQGHDKEVTGRSKEKFLSQAPLQDVEEEGEGDRDGDDSKDSKDSEKQQSLFQSPVQPLRIRKRAPRGARPLPPSPADAQSRNGPAAIPLPVPLSLKPEPQIHQAVLSPPPPFTIVDSSLDGLPYERSMHKPSSSAPLTLPTSNLTSFHPIPVHRVQQRPSSSYSPAPSYADSYRRISHNPYLESSSSNLPQNIPGVTRLKFDPSVAYGAPSNATREPKEDPSDSTPVNPKLLYSSAVSSYLHPATAHSGPRSSYIGARNRYSTSPRPSSSASTLAPSGQATPTSQFHSPYIPEFSASHQSLSRPRSIQGDHGRWATSEAEFTRDIYP